MISISAQSPAEGDRNVDLDTLISFVVEKNNIDVSKIKIQLNGTIVFQDSTFLDDYDGPFSEFAVNANNVSFVIDPIINFNKDTVVTLKIYYLDNTGSSIDYSFFTISDKPILYFSNVKDGQTIEDPIQFRFEFIDELDGVNLSGVNFFINEMHVINNGVFHSFYDESSSEITSITNGIAITVDHPEFFRDGEYNIKYTIPDGGTALLQQNINFTVKLKKVILPQVFPMYNFVGFVNGLKKATSLGDGSSIKLEWAKLISRVPKSDVFALIYYGNERLKIFDLPPKYIAKKSVNDFTDNVYTTGKNYYFAVRGLETFKDSFDFTGMTEKATDVFELPDQVSVSGVFDENSFSLTVNDVTGYPEKGLLIIKKSEVVKYTSIDRATNTFNIPSNGRGLNNTSKGFFVDGDSVEIFVMCQDSNNNIIKSTPHYVDGYVSGRELDNVGVLVTDYTDNDKKFFQGFDFCGYHQPLPDRVLQGVDDCGSYIGGEFNKQRGMNLYDRMLNREEVLLDQVGEPIVLLKRKWDGPVCECVTSRTQHPKEKTCEKCFGTGYIGGFDQFLNKRRLDRRVMVRFKETVEDLTLHMSKHMSVQYEPSCWTLPMPAIRDRDIIIRFDFTDDLEYFYEVKDVSKEKVVFGHFGRQNLNLKRLDKTDLINTFQYIK